MPLWVREAIDRWMLAARVDAGRIFRAVSWDTHPCSLLSDILAASRILRSRLMTALAACLLPERSNCAKPRSHQLTVESYTKADFSGSTEDHFRFAGHPAGKDRFQNGLKSGKRWETAPSLVATDSLASCRAEIFFQSAGIFRRRLS
jgi:hypothetical protein